MLTVQIEHPIRDYKAWKVAFDQDPAQRQASGVRGYRVSRPLDAEWYVIIDLDFDDRGAAEAFVAKMRTIWNQVEGSIMTGPQVRIMECMEKHDY
jgi:hypothetical protein